MDAIVSYFSNLSLGETIRLVIEVCAILGIGIDLTPQIKFNPIRWIFRQIGNLFFADTNKRIEDISKKLEDVEKKVDENKKEVDIVRMKTIRSTILDFANCIEKRQRTEDECDEIFELYEEYESLLLKYDMKNGRTNHAMDKIQTYYDILIAKNIKDSFKGR